MFPIHCVINTHTTLSGKVKLNIKTCHLINKIRAHALNSRLFQQLCVDDDEDLKNNEVRWLSEGNCLKRFMIAFDSVVTFLEKSLKNTYNNKYTSNLAYIYA